MKYEYYINSFILCNMQIYINTDSTLIFLWYRNYTFEEMIFILYWFKACVRYFSLFLKEKHFFVISNEVHWKEILLTFVFSSHHFTNIHSRLSYHTLPAFLKLRVLKNKCMCNRDNAHDVIFSPKKKSRREVNQRIKQKSRQTSGKVLKLIWMVQKIILPLIKGLKCLVILKIFCKYWYILNKWRTVSKHFFASNSKVKV